MPSNQPTDLVVQVPASLPGPASNVQYYAYEEEQGPHLRDYWHVLLKRKWWFAGVFAAVMAATALATYLMTPVYVGRITLQIIQDNPSAIMGGGSTDPLGALTGTSELDRFYETQYKILQSQAIAYRIIDSLDLRNHPSYKKLEENSKDDPPGVIRQKYAQGLLDQLKVQPVKNSFLVDISFRSPDKMLAQKVPESIQKEYLQLAMNTRRQSYAMLKEWLNGELTRLGKKLEISEQNVYEDGRKKDNLSLEDNQYNVIVQKYVELSKALTAAQADRAEKESQYRQLLEKGTDAPLITNNALIVQLRQQLIAQESQASGSGAILGGRHPERQAELAKIKDLRSRLNYEVKRIETSTRADYETVCRTETLLRREYEAQRKKLTDMQDDLVQHHVLTRDLQTNQALYEALLARMKEANIASTMVASNVSVITAPEKPFRPWMPRPFLFLAIAAVVGSIGGVAAAFFVEYLDSSIKSVEEMEKVCRIPTLGMVPLVERRELAKESLLPELMVHQDPTSMIGEAVFHIRTAIMLSASGSPPQVIVVTSSSLMEGKTSTTSNLTISLTGKDRKCLIIDGDLRKPRLHKVWKLVNDCGLSNYLTGGAAVEDIIRATEVPNLYVITAGPTPPNPNELLASSAFRGLVERLREDFDHIVIDSPPIVGFADARSLAATADGTVLVFKHHSTTREAARLAVQLLSQNHLRILGGILTMARRDRMPYGGYYGYYHYYNKYYRNYYLADGKTRKTGRGQAE